MTRSRLFASAVALGSLFHCGLLFAETLTLENGTGEAITDVVVQDEGVAIAEPTPVALPSETGTEPDVKINNVVAETAEEEQPVTPGPIVSEPEKDCLASLKVTLGDGETLETPTLDLCHVATVVIGDDTVSPYPRQISGLPAD